jgi:hypothetical protein
LYNNGHALSRIIKTPKSGVWYPQGTCLEFMDVKAGKLRNKVKQTGHYL